MTIESQLRIFDLTSDEQCLTCPVRHAPGKVLVEECGWCGNHRVRREMEFEQFVKTSLKVVVALLLGLLLGKLNFPF